MTITERDESEEELPEEGVTSSIADAYILEKDGNYTIALDNAEFITSVKITMSNIVPSAQAKNGFSIISQDDYSVTLAYLSGSFDTEELSAIITFADEVEVEKIEVASNTSNNSQISIREMNNNDRLSKLDLNSDGNIDLRDFSSISNYFGMTFRDDKWNDFGDVLDTNCDEIFDVADVIAIIAG